MNDAYLGPCKIFIRVMTPDGTTFDAIGESEQVTINSNWNVTSDFFHPRKQRYIERKIGFPFYTDIHIDISRFIISKRDDPVNWEQVAQDVLADVTPVLPPEIKRLGSGDAGHSG